MRHMFNPAFELLMKKEGGYSPSPVADPGGETCYGIARNFWPDWEGWDIIDDMKITGLISNQELIFERCEKALRKFYKVNFWEPLQCNLLPAGVDTFIFDCGVNQGVGVAAKVLQASCGAVQDGVIGPNTLASVDVCLPVVLLDKCLRGRLYQYMIVRNHQGRVTNGKGWVNRTLDVYSLCLEEAE